MLLFSAVALELLLSSMVKMNPIDNKPETAVTTANNEFSFKIFKMLSKEGNNDVMSSLSILSAFSVLMNGAQSETLEDMRRFLEFEKSGNSVSESNVNEGFKAMLRKYEDLSKLPESDELYRAEHPAKLYINNRVIQDKSLSILPEFERKTNNYFKADIQKADFANNAVEETKKVNDWVSNATNHKITKIFDNIPSDTSLVILNTIYFKGNWFESFNERETKKLDFYNNGVTAVKTDTMFQRDEFNCHDSQELNAELLELKYYGQSSRESDLTFVIILPKERNGLKALKEKINARNFDRAVQSMKGEETNVYLPKFRVEAEYDLMHGIKPTPHFLTKGADFSRLSSSPQIVGEAIHKVFIDLNEKGTEAAAVTALRMVPYSATIYPRTVTFRADHPFLYFIRDKTNGMILFSGQINQL